MSRRNPVPGVLRRFAGVARLLARLGWRDTRAHPLGPALLAVTVTVATASLTLAFEVWPAAIAPWDATWRAAGSPHVVVAAAPDTNVDEVLAAPEVTETAGPFPLAYDEVRKGPYALDVQVVGRDAQPTSVDQPVVTDGSWVRPGGVVVEGSLAEALEIDVGDTLPVADRHLTVVGIAISGAQKPIAFAQPGLLWATRGDVAAMTTEGENGFEAVSLRLSNPGLAPGFAANWDNPIYRGWPPTSSDPFLSVTSWEEIRYDSLTDVNFARAGLITGALALALLTITSAAIYLTSRLEAQTRRMGLLKAVGASPRLAARLAIVQQLAVTIPAAVVGITAGWFTAPLIARPEGAYLLEGTHLPPFDPATVGIVLGVTVGLTALPAVRPARRAARASTIRTLTRPARPPRRSARLIALSARLPTPALLGVRLAARRPGRALLSALGMGVSVGMVFVALAMEQGIAGDAARQDAGSFGVAIAYDKLRLVVYVFTVALIALAAINALLIAWATTLDTATSSALARALGATPRQVGAAVALAQSIPAVIAAVIGVPFGLAIYLAALAAGGDDATSAPGAFLVIAVPAILLLTIALTLVPTRLAARQPVVEALRGDA
jgi:putative ABC transport system permease protein